MSRETLEWLNTHTLIGYSGELGKAWHHDGSGENHFDGPVPVVEVKELFDWEAVAVPVKLDTVEMVGHTTDADGYKAIIHPDDLTVFNIVTGQYAIHQYAEWLVDEVQTLLDEADDLQIGSAGLLRGGGQAWVQIRPSETVMVGGDEMLPWILATTSHDGSLATQYKGQRQRVVCDNTMAAGLSEKTAQYRVRHTKNSKLKMAEARQALEIIYAADQEFQRAIEEWQNTEFNTALYRDLNNRLIPEVEVKVEDGKVVNQRAINNRNATIEKLEEMWFEDERVTPYKDTVWGAMQAHNTWFHWGRTRGTGGEKDLLKARQIQSNLTGDTDAWDRKVLAGIEELIAA